MKKFVEITYLFDFYANLLTPKQKELLSQYYFEDFSLGELSLQHEISRQSIFDTIKKAEQKLLDFEEKLRLWEKYRRQEVILTELQQATHTLEAQLNDNQKIELESIKLLTQKLLSEI
jgi:hypothetical protein